MGFFVGSSFLKVSTTDSFPEVGDRLSRNNNVPPKCSPHNWAKKTKEDKNLCTSRKRDRWLDQSRKWNWKTKKVYFPAFFFLPRILFIYEGLSIYPDISSKNKIIEYFNSPFWRRIFLTPPLSRDCPRFDIFFLLGKGGMWKVVTTTLMNIAREGKRKAGIPAIPRIFE